MSETPETDMLLSNQEFDKVPYDDCCGQLAEFCRKLEQERDKFKKERDAKIDKIIHMQKFIDHTQERWDWHKNELEEEQRKLREDLMRAAADCALENARLERELNNLQAYADKLADGLPEGMLPKDVENLRNANAGLAEDLRKAKLERGEALAALRQTCATNTEIRRELDEAEREIAKLKASSNENYWELSRQRGNMLHALHEISAAVKRGMKQGGATKTK